MKPRLSTRNSSMESDRQKLENSIKFPQSK
jgi:hypothetical protein